MLHIRRAIATLALLPYVLFFAVVLCPVALTCYALAAIVRTAYSNALAGWNEHK